MASTRPARNSMGHTIRKAAGVKVIVSPPEILPNYPIIFEKKVKK
jgi:hypothetical protein